MAIYDRYAEIYDRSGQIAFSLRMIPYLQQVLERHRLQGRSMLDLACGSGNVALSFAQQGWRVYGVDASAQMLAEARRKAAEQGLALLLSQQDMRSFVLPERVDLVTCLYDSLNYLLTIEDVQQAFGRVAAYLKPGGLFIFDMNTAFALAEVWDHNSYFSEDQDLSVVMQSEYEEESQMARVKVVAFVRRDELYERIEETHVERAYPEHAISTALRRAGLEVVDRYEAFTFDPPGSRTLRILWVAWQASAEPNGDHSERHS